MILKKDTITISDNINQGRYFTTEYTFNELTAAYFNLSDDGLLHNLSVKKYKPIDTTGIDTYSIFGLNPCYITKSLMLYLNPKWLNFEIGTRAYNLDAILYEVSRIKDDMFSSTGYLDVRRFCVYRDHKIMLEYRIRYLMEKGNMDCDEYILDEIIQLINGYDMIINMVLKYNLMCKSDILSNIINNLEQLVDKERNITQNIIDGLVKNNNLQWLVDEVYS